MKCQSKDDDNDRVAIEQTTWSDATRRDARSCMDHPDHLDHLPSGGHYSPPSSKQHVVADDASIKCTRCIPDSDYRSSLR